VPAIYQPRRCNNTAVWRRTAAGREEGEEEAAWAELLPMRRPRADAAVGSVSTYMPVG
jgi:hypothetical protein